MARRNSQRTCHSSTHSPPSSSATTSSGIRPEPAAAMLDPAIKAECRKALSAGHNNQYANALKIIKDAAKHYGDLACLRYTESRIHSFKADAIDNPKMKRQCFLDATVSARKAMAYAPDSILYSSHLIKMLLETVTSDAGFQEVVEECERALQMVDPRDPALDEMTDIQDLSRKSKDGRLEIVRNDIEGRLKKAKRIQTVKGKRKAEASQGQQQQVLRQERTVGAGEPAPATQTPSIDSFKKNDAVGRRRKPARVDSKKIAQVSEFWNTLSDDAKTELLTVKLDELKKYVESSDDAKAREVFMRAIKYVEKEKRWDFDQCIHCANERFQPGMLLSEHVVDKHKDKVLDFTLSGPERASDKWTKDIETGVWKPRDVDAALEMIEKCWSANSDRDLQASGSKDKVFEDLDWPLADDTELEWLLQSIHNKLKYLVKTQCFAMSHVYKLMEYILPVLLGIFSGSDIKRHGMTQTLLSLCFLGETQLTDLNKFLHDLVCCCDNVAGDDKVVAKLVEDARNQVNSTVVNSQDFSHLMLRKSSPTTSIDDVEIGESFVVSLYVDFNATPREIVDAWNIETEARKNLALVGISLLRSLDLAPRWNEASEAAGAPKAIDETEICKMECEILACDALCTNDYRSLMRPLLMSFIQQRLQRPMSELALKKSNAAAEELLAEIEMDSEKKREAKEKSDKKKEAKRRKGSTARIKETCADEKLSDDGQGSREKYSDYRMEVVEDATSQPCVVDRATEECGWTEVSYSRGRRRYSKLQNPSSVDSLNVTGSLSSTSAATTSSTIQPSGTGSMSQPDQMLHMKDMVEKATSEPLGVSASVDDLEQKGKEVVDESSQKMQDTKAMVEKSTNEPLDPAGMSLSVNDLEEMRKEECPAKAMVEKTTSEPLEGGFSDPAGVSASADDLEQKGQEVVEESRDNEEVPTKLDEPSKESEHVQPEPDEVLEPQEQNQDENLEEQRTRSSSDTEPNVIEPPYPEADFKEYDCFLNTAVQSLWSIREFRYAFMRNFACVHLHVGNPCIVCGLLRAFSFLEVELSSSDPTDLRIALVKFHPDIHFYRKDRVNYISDVLAEILNRLHYCFTHRFTETISEPCTSDACLAHRIFSCVISERSCCNSCGHQPEPLKFNSYFLNLKAGAIREFKRTHPTGSFEDILKLDILHLTCDPEEGGCGNINPVDYTLLAAPQVFSVVLGWETNGEPADQITETMRAISTEVHLGNAHRGVDPERKYRLKAMVCFHRYHYCFFRCSSKHDQWTLYNNKDVLDIGRWNAVIDTCGEIQLQPQVLFFQVAT